jgi:uncharacterized membrane protein YgdD (TMEM256/DUF423 family)
MMILRIAAVLGFLGVALGAFGAHALRERLSPALLQVWNTAVLYHLLHAVALLSLGLYVRASSGALGAGMGADVRAPAWLFVAGILIFSGSLYALALTGIKILGAVTPLGGLCFLAGWGWLAVLSVKNA